MVCHKKLKDIMDNFPILFPECVVEPNLSLYHLKPGHFLQKIKTKQDLCGSMVSPVYKCHDKKKSGSQGGLQAASANDKNIHVYKFVSLPVSDLSPCGLCQIEEMSHLSEALMPPASLSRCVVLECGVYI